MEAGIFRKEKEKGSYISKSFEPQSKDDFSQINATEHSAGFQSELNKKHDKVFGSLIDNDTFFQNESKNIISDYVMDSKNPSIQTDNKLDSHQKSRSNKLNSKTLKSGQIKVSNLDCELISEF